MRGFFAMNLWPEAAFWTTSKVSQNICLVFALHLHHSHLIWKVHIWKFSLTSRKVFNFVMAEYGDFLILMRVIYHQSFMGVAIMGAQSKRGALSAWSLIPTCTPFWLCTPNCHRPSSSSSSSSISSSFVKVIVVLSWSQNSLSISFRFYKSFQIWIWEYLKSVICGWVCSQNIRSHYKVEPLLNFTCLEVVNQVIVENV